MTGPTRFRLLLAASVLFHLAIVVVMVRLLPATPSRTAGLDTRTDGPTELALYDVIPARVAAVPLPRPVPVPPVPVPPVPKSPVSDPATTKDAKSPERAVSGGNGTGSSAPPVGGGSGGAGSGTAGNSGGKPLHRPAPAGAKIVYVLDRSGSMNQRGRLAHAVACLRASLRQMNEAVLFQIVLYHSQAEVLTISGSKDLVPATPENIASAERLLELVLAEGASAHIEGVRRALGLRPDAIILLTDADDFSPDTVARITGMNRESRIFPMILGSELGTPEVSSLMRLAGQNRGQAVSVPLP
jgi:von Willebrand factor type A domain